MGEKSKLRIRKPSLRPIILFLYFGVLCTVSYYHPTKKVGVVARGPDDAGQTRALEGRPAGQPVSRDRGRQASVDWTIK